MGIELALGVASLALNVISGVNQYNSSQQQAAALGQAQQKQDAAVAAQREANNIASAQQRIASANDLRQRIREERVRRSFMENAAANTGTNASSGVLGGVSALDANFGTLVSNASSVSKGNEGINLNSQLSATLDSQSKRIISQANISAAQADAFSSFLGMFSDSFKSARSIFFNPNSRN